MHSGRISGNVRGTGRCWNSSREIAFSATLTENAMLLTTTHMASLSMNVVASSSHENDCETSASAHLFRPSRDWPGKMIQSVVAIRRLVTLNTICIVWTSMNILIWIRTWARRSAAQVSRRPRDGTLGSAHSIVGSGCVSVWPAKNLLHNALRISIVRCSVHAD